MAYNCIAINGGFNAGVIYTCPAGRTAEVTIHHAVGDPILASNLVIGGGPGNGWGGVLGLVRYPATGNTSYDGIAGASTVPVNAPGAETALAVISNGGGDPGNYGYIPRKMSVPSGQTLEIARSWMRLNLTIVEEY